MWKILRKWLGLDVMEYKVARLEHDLRLMGREIEDLRMGLKEVQNARR